MVRIAKGAALLAGLWLMTATASPGGAAEVGEPMPEFTLATFDGGNVSRASLLGKPALIVFWNTWCPNCRRELPEIDRLARRIGPEKAAVLAVNTGLNDTPRRARAYWKMEGFAIPVGFDASFEVGKAFKVPGVPTILLVDAKGIVRFKGAELPEDAGERLRQLLPQ